VPSSIQVPGPRSVANGRVPALAPRSQAVPDNDAWVVRYRYQQTVPRTEQRVVAALSLGRQDSRQVVVVVEVVGECRAGADSGALCRTLADGAGFQNSRTTRENADDDTTVAPKDTAKDWLLGIQLDSAIKVTHPQVVSLITYDLERPFVALCVKCPGCCTGSVQFGDVAWAPQSQRVKKPPRKALRKVVAWLRLPRRYACPIAHQPLFRRAPAKRDARASFVRSPRSPTQHECLPPVPVHLSPEARPFAGDGPIR
jgi:hypothetical protein